MSKRWLLFPIVLTCFSAAGSACNSSDDGSAGKGGADADAGESAGGASSMGEPAGGADANAGGPGDAGGAAGESGGAGTSGSAGTANAPALPLDTFLYTRKITEDRDELVARSFTTGKERVVTDLTGDGSDGWEIWGHTLSPDRKTIVLASLYDPTKADNDTKLATRRLWSLATDGSGFERLTPVFENAGGGRTGFNISVQDPAFTADGKGVLYDYGEWWYEGTSLQGGSLPWVVPIAGGLPALFPTSSGCTVVNPSVNPATGDVLLVHSVCVRSQDTGIFLYPRAGGTEPIQLVPRGFGAGGVDPALTTASWAADGSGFAFVGSIDVDRDGSIDSARSLLVYDMVKNEVSSLVVPDKDSYVRSATVSGDVSSVVYCLQRGDAVDLHGIDLTQDPPVDFPLTDDGMSCDPVF